MQRLDLVFVTRHKARVWTNGTEEYSDSRGPRGDDSPPPSAHQTWKRPTGLVIVGALWSVEAIYNIVLTLVLYGPQVSNWWPDWEQYAVQDAKLRAFLEVLSLVQLFAVYWSLEGGAWSHYIGLAISALVTAGYAGLFCLYYSAPSGIGLMTPLLLEGFGVSIAFTALIWVYFTRPHVQAYLNRWL